MMIPAIVIVALLAVVLFLYNKLVMLRNKVSEAFSTMDVYLKKRFDLIPELIAVVKGYAKHEATVLEDIAKMRTTGDQADRFDGENRIAKALERIMVVSEAYPDLKANESFLDLQSNLSRLEDDIAAARRYYNGSVRMYNDSVQTVPTNLIALLFGFKTKPMFTISDEERRVPQSY